MPRIFAFQILLILLMNNVASFANEQSTHDLSSTTSDNFDLKTNCVDDQTREAKEITEKYRKSGSLTNTEKATLRVWLFGEKATYPSRNLAATLNKRAILIGGSGEDFNDKNFFSEDFNRFRSNLEKRGWNVNTAFDGQKHRIPNSDLSTNENIKKQLDGLVKTSQTGEEAMIFFHSHGKEKEFEQTTHSITSENSAGFNLDEVQPYLEQLKQKGVKVALVDLSCFSGNTQKLTVPDICAVTLGSKDYVTVCSSPENAQGFTTRFTSFSADNVGPVSLEDQFLAARLSDTESPNLPQISSITTPSLEGWDYFLERTDPDSFQRKKKIKGDDGFIMLDLTSFRKKKTGNCEADEIQNMIGLQNEAIIAIVDKAAQENLKQIQNEIQNNLKEYFSIQEKLEEATKKLKNFYRKHKWPLKEDDEAFSFVSSASVAALEMVIDMTDSKINLDQIAWLDNDSKSLLKKLKPHRDKVTAMLKDSKKSYQSAWDDYTKFSDELSKQGKKVLATERKFYADYAKSIKGKEQNPCNTFML